MIAFLEAVFEIENFGEACYLYECIAPMRALFMQKTAPTKYKKVAIRIS